MNTKSKNDVVITGIGLVTSLGVGVGAHEELLNSGAIAPAVNDQLIPPYPLHPMPEIDWNEQIPRRGDQRQMGNWQKLGVYAAGLALDDAGFKEDADACSTMDMIVCGGGGERDSDVDTIIIEESLKRNDKDVLLNEKLRTEVRPTLFLSQLSNLMAGNISIVHKVTGSSRTFMGEEGSGVSSIETAVARIQAGSSTHCLVGGAFVAEREDYLYVIEAVNALETSPARPIWQRDDKRGIVFGSAGVFLILESKEHATARSAKIYATIDGVLGDAGARDEAAFNKRMTRLNTELNASDDADTLVLSGTSGRSQAMQLEKNYLTSHHANSAIRTTSAVFGHTLEAQFPLGLALGAIALKNDVQIAPFAEDLDAPMSKSATKAVVTSVGHHRSEGLATLSKA
ncbi:MAG: beta-ketoacyl-ACP synthase [Rhizobiaceae bacterium]|nr:beta-ketoacyl-ACP synthase [Rhizobiaceae bacterium]